MKNLIKYLKPYTKESILAPFFKLLEVAFDDIGTKKLMAKAAGAHMKKL